LSYSAESLQVMQSRSVSRIGKVCALVAATLILPVLAYAGGNNNNQGGNGQGGNGQGGTYTVPERGPGILLLTTTIGAVLVFGAIQRSRSKT
jgi:hypothetical protein